MQVGPRRLTNGPHLVVARDAYDLMRWGRATLDVDLPADRVAF